MNSISSRKPIQKAKAIRQIIRPNQRRNTTELTYEPQAQVFTWRTGRLVEKR
jgi:hypothetical protein